jgi:plasmid maintenance system antidote protein VapI
MNGEVYQHLIDKVGMTQVGAAKFFGVDERTSRRWVKGELTIPDSVALLLPVMFKIGLTPYHVLAIKELVNKEVQLETIDVSV